MQHPRSYTILHNPTAERDACGIGFAADAKGRPAREIVDALLEGLRRVEHRGATAADGKTGDGAGVLLPISPALVPSPGCGLATVFLRDEAAYIASLSFRTVTYEEEIGDRLPACRRPRRPARCDRGAGPRPRPRR